MSINVVLVEPEIPQNTGNIARTCAATGAKLHLVKPLGFSVEDKYLKRAGLDYWDLVDITYYENLEEFLEKTKGSLCFYATTKSNKAHSDVTYEENCYILFGKETKGLPESLVYANPEQGIRIPMINEARSLNLGNSAAIVIYEAYRQLGYPGLR